MISLENILISDELKEVFFCCDLEKCKGVCCVEGDAGAPLEEEEIGLLDEYIGEIKPFMTTEGIAEIGQTGVFDYDAAGNYVTPLIRHRECAYICFEDNIARCAIEVAFQQGKIPFPKPLSCHLYPVRISSTAVGEAVNYHHWHICETALIKGLSDHLHLYLFLKEALIRKFGEDWYKKLVRLIRQV